MCCSSDSVGAPLLGNIVQMIVMRDEIEEQLVNYLDSNGADCLGLASSKGSIRISSVMQGKERISLDLLKGKRV